MKEYKKKVSEKTKKSRLLQIRSDVFTSLSESGGGISSLFVLSREPDAFLNENLSILNSGCV